MINMAGIEKQIAAVKDNAEKQEAYRKQLGRYRRALNSEFYFEAMLIVYAMIEDRLRSFLYHIGVLNTRESAKSDVKETKKFHIEIYNNFFDKKFTGLDLKNISAKYGLIRAVLNWVTTTEGAEGKYQIKLKYACESLDAEDVFNCIDKLEKWCDYRNEIIHGLMNKKVESLYSELAEKADEGMKLATKIDAYVDIVSKGHIVRQSLNLKTE